MNRFSLLVISLFVLLLSLATASATLSTDLTGNQLDLGGLTQEASDINNNLEEYDTGDITFGSGNPITLSVAPVAPYVQSSSTVVNNINVTIDSQVTSGNTTVTISARVPEKLPAVDADGVAKAFKVAVLTFSDGTDTVNVDLFVQRKSQLTFDDVDIKYADDTEKVTDGETIDDLMPGDPATFEFKVENTFSSSSNMDIDDVTIYVKDDNNDLDIDEEEEMGTIRDNDDDTESISVDVDDDADEGVYNLFLWVVGDDEYGARHGERYTVKIDIEKEKDDVALKRVDLNPDSVNLCDNRMVSLTVSIENIGKNDQDEAAITVRSTKLNYLNTINDIELDEDDARTKTFSISVPLTATPGSYIFQISAINDDGESTDDKSITLLVSDCVSSTSSSSQSRTQTLSPAPSKVQLLTPDFSGDTAAQPPAGHIEFEADDHDEDEDFSLVIIIVLIGIVLALIILMIFVLV